MTAKIAKIKRKYLKAGTRVETTTTEAGEVIKKTNNYQIFVPSKLSEKDKEIEMVERASKKWKEWA